jgi:hypothetical protein
MRDMLGVVSDTRVKSYGAGYNRAHECARDRESTGIPARFSSIGEAVRACLTS